MTILGHTPMGTVSPAPPTLQAFDTDASAEEITAALPGLHAQGYAAVGCYLGRNLTAEVLVMAAQLDMGVFAFGEFGSTNPFGGGVQGGADARQLVAWAAAVGYKGAIYLAMDAEIPDGEWPNVLAYFAAAGPVLVSGGNAPGLYGQTVLWEELRGYQYFAHAPDGTPPPSFAHLVCDVPPNTFLAGLEVDIDIIQSPTDFGAYNADGPWPKPVPPPPPPEVPMALPIFVKTVNGTYVQGAGGQLHLLNAEGVKVITDNKCDVLDDPTASVANAMGIAPGPAL